MPEDRTREEREAGETGRTAREQAEGREAVSGESTSGLISGVITDARDLIAAEIESTKLEVKEELKQAKTAMITAALGGGTLAVGALLVTLMLVYGLAQGTSVPLWASYGIIGGILVIAGGALLGAGKLKARDADGWPEESVAQVKQDVKWIKDNTRSR